MGQKKKKTEGGVSAEAIMPKMKTHEGGPAHSVRNEEQVISLFNSILRFKSAAMAHQTICGRRMSGNAWAI